VDKKEIRDQFIEIIKRVNKQRGRDGMFPRATETYRNYSEEIRDGHYKDKTFEELKPSLFQDFEDDYVSDMFPDQAKEELEDANNKAIARGKGMKPPPNKEKGGNPVVPPKEKRNRQTPLSSNYR
jgi:hypothetical protein